jgi:hypothetical protein
VEPQLLDLPLTLVNALKRPSLSLMWVGAVIAAEVLGRRSPSDLWDAIGVFLFSALVASTIIRTEKSDSPVAVKLRRLGRAWRRRAVGWWPELGVDFRGEPRVARGFPSSLLGVSLCVAGVAVAALASRTSWPGAARALALPLTPTLYFLALSVCWGALVSTLGAATFSIGRDLNDHLLNAGVPAARREGVALAAGLAWFGLIAAVVFLVPVWIAWVLCGVLAGCGAFTAWAIDRHETVRILWRSRPSGSTKLFYAGASIRWDALTMACLLPALTVPATGIGWDGPLAGTMPITVGLGLAAIWAGTFAFLSYLSHGAFRLLGLARHDPAKREPIPLIIERDLALPDEVEARLRHHGFAPGPEGRTPGQRRPSHRAGPAIRVSLDAETLASLASLAELRRLDHALLRDRLLDGLKDLLAVAAGRRFKNGTGFWLAPHIWYARGLTRDADDPDYHTIGPPYHRAIPRRARQHLHAVLGALEVDLIFAEDTAPPDAIPTVFERLFDIYDVFGPGRIEERAFVGLQRVRVILHDFTFGEPFRHPGYTEPTYEEIGRARILHIMRDRGEGRDEPDPTPAAPYERPRVITV